MFAVLATNRFRHRARKFFQRHPDLRPRYAEVVDLLRKDPFHSCLGLHPLKGDLEGLHAVRLTHACRITLTIVIRAREVVLLDIGTHDEVYGP